MPINPQLTDDGPNLLVNIVKVLLVVIPAWIVVYFIRRKQKGKKMSNNPKS